MMCTFGVKNGKIVFYEFIVLNRLKMKCSGFKIKAF